MMARSKNLQRPAKLPAIDRHMIFLERNPEVAHYFIKFLIEYNATIDQAMKLTSSLKVAQVADIAEQEYRRLKKLRMDEQDVNK